MDHVFKLLFLFCLIFNTGLYAASPTANYWQQEVNYTIDVSLNDQTHELDGFINIEYINHSPNDLAFLYFHLWPNAYKDQSTAFAAQQLENGDTDFYYSSVEERGYINQLDFRANETSIPFEYDEKHVDICKLLLPKPLKSGDTLLISTPFHVKIPQSFSRLGHVGESYQITQWYPKPAVYDASGWHPMPYLSQGEFYSEFGSFDVRITVPKNYVVGATGDLQNADEVEWLNNKAEETAAITNFGNDLSFPPSDTTTKTLHYLQKDVHDFAWFADKRFYVLKGSVQLPNSDRSVDTWAMFTDQEADLWQEGAIEYLNDAVHFYSAYSGEYPYQHATAVQSALSAGAGMEYPNITVIGRSRTAMALETVIVHEVGHNWFYGILGSNERDHAWLDEGVNSYYEKRYFAEKYPDRKLLGRVADTGLARFFDLSQYKADVIEYYPYLINAKRHEDQPIEAHATEYTSLNYGAIVYNKSAMALAYLEAVLGTKEFDRIMQLYFERFKFKHPQPHDFRNLFEQESGRFLEWFFDELILTTKTTDYRIKKLERKGEKIGESYFDKVTIKQKPESVRGPYTLSALKDGEVIRTIWYDGFWGEMEVIFPSLDYDELRLDIAQHIPETNRRNNRYKRKGLLHRGSPFALQFLGSLENPNKKQLFFSPSFGYNYYDKSMLGLAFYNSLLPNQKIEFTANPMFAFGSKRLVGSGNIDINMYPKKAFQRVKFRLATASFTNAYLRAYTKVEPDSGNTPELVYEAPIRWLRLNPSVQVQLKEKSLRSRVRKTFTLAHSYIARNISTPTINGSNDLSDFNVSNPLALEDTAYYVNQISYDYQNKRAIQPYSYNIALHQGQGFALAQASINYQINYPKVNKGLRLRAYLGGFIYNNDNNNIAKIYLSQRGPQNYLYNDIYLGRRQIDTWYSRQISARQGAFKVPVSRDAEAILAVNMHLAIPKIPVLQLYGDVAYTVNPSFSSGSNLYFDAGIAAVIVPDAFAIYLPIVHSSNIQTSFTANNTKWYQKFTFLIDFNAFNPIERIRTISL